MHQHSAQRALEPALSVCGQDQKFAFTNQSAGLTWIKKPRRRWYSLEIMFSSTRSISEASESKRPRRRRRFAHVTMVLAWAAFWLSTAFFPCCEALAGVFGDYPDHVPRAVSHAQPAHDMDETPDCPDCSPYEPCGHSVSAGPASFDAVTGLPVQHSPLEWFAIDAPVPSNLVAATYSWNSAPREIPPPLVRLYLRELRLLL